MRIEYPFILNIGAQSLVIRAREYPVLPVPVKGVELAAVLTAQCGKMQPGLYMLSGGGWTLVLPHTELNASHFVDKSITVYCNMLADTELDSDPETVVYMNGGRNQNRVVPAMDSNFWAVVSLRSQTSTPGQGSGYVLPRATATTLGGIQVIPNSGLELYNGFLSVIKPDPVYQVHLPAQTTIQEAAGGVRYEWLIDVGAARLSDLSKCVFTVSTAPTQEVTFAVMKGDIPVGVLAFAPGSTVGTEIPNSATPTTFFRNNVLRLWQNGSTQRMAAMNVLITLERLG